MAYRYLPLAFEVAAARLSDLVIPHLTPLHTHTTAHTNTQTGDAPLVSALLGCFGDLLRADLSPAWPSDLEQSAAAASGLPPPGPRCSASVTTNDVTRARVELEAAAFESALAPRVAARLLHALAVAAAEKFTGASGRRLVWLEALFGYLEEYLGKVRALSGRLLSMRARHKE